ncbi:MAG: cyanophycin synthetase, partial [Pseudomonadales bacterium]
GELEIQLALPGRHNALNAVAAVAVATDEGLPDEDIVSGLANFGGVGRRFEIHGHFKVGDGDFILVDDYGHHPSEVRATIESVRAGWPDSRLLMVYQPHRYTRTLELFDQFVDVLASVDCLVLMDVYSAGEAPINGATGLDLFKAIERRNVDVSFVPNVEDVPDHLEEIVSAGDFVLTQGAGETSKLAHLLRSRWNSRRVTA